MESICWFIPGNRSWQTALCRTSHQSPASIGCKQNLRQLGGGASAIRQYLQAGLIDEMHIAIVPVLLGSGEHLFAGIDTVALGYKCSEHVTTASATHFVLTR